jgi:hypothetical protein
MDSTAGTDTGFQVRGGAIKKNCAERKEARKSLGYFVWRITILRQKILFFAIAEGGAKIVGVFRVKNHDFTPKNHIFSNFRGERAECPPPPGSAPGQCLLNLMLTMFYVSLLMTMVIVQHERLVWINRHCSYLWPRP